MELHDPLLISARLMPAVRICSAWLSVNTRSYKAGRTTYDYYIDIPGVTKFEGHELSVCGHADNERTVLSALETLLSFLLLEDGEPVENSPFTKSVRDWVGDYRDELETLQTELQEKLQ